MNAAPIHLAGERLMLDPAGALFWPAARLLAVADLHLDKGSAGAVGSRLPPRWDSRATLDRLSLLLRRWSPAIVLVLGDSLYDSAGGVRLPGVEAARLRAITAAHRFVWITGNPDSAPPDGPGEESAATFASGKLVFRHQPAPGASGEICGLLHPRATIASRAGPERRPCFVVDARRVLLPAFGADTGGLDLTDPAIASVFPRGGRVFLLGEQRLSSFPLAAFSLAASRRPGGGGPARM
ncbi:MAG: ligase-associated DNA damage response endonuclease PdeM [Proteobacteria bacterium]|nr:ligase-associated DNA damage response endonuclease PdeM [Pseudomonadota bacterium]